jgi:hypothetical protein
LINTTDRPRTGIPVKSFEFKVADETYELAMGKCAVALFYKNPEVDYIAINHTDDADDTVRIFNPHLARWAAGFAPLWDEEDGCFYYPTTYWNDKKEPAIDGKTFREAHGWNPTTVIKNEPFDWEMDRYVYLQTTGIDNDINKLLGDQDAR